MLGVVIEYVGITCKILKDYPDNNAFATNCHLELRLLLSGLKAAYLALGEVTWQMKSVAPSPISFSSWHVTCWMAIEKG